MIANLFNAVIVLECLWILWLLTFRWENLMAHARTTIAGFIVLAALALVNAVWFYRFHGMHDCIEATLYLAVALGFFQSADGK